MRKIFEQLVITLKQFLKQRDHLLLLVPCTDADVALLLNALRSLDRESDADLFLLFSEEFHSADQFVTEVSNRLREEHSLINEATGSHAFKLAPIPKEFLDPTRPAAERFEAGLGYARSLVEPAKGQHFLWGLAPGSIWDSELYLELLAALTPQPAIRPWMRGARIVARVPQDFQLELSPLAGAKRVQVRPLSIPPNAQEEELLEAANSAQAPMRDRMQAEVQLAYIDYAYSRFDQAIKRFLKALAFFQWAEVPAMEGLIICGLGDVARRQANLHDAQHWYECAVVPAAKTGNPILLSMIIQNLAAVAFEQGRFVEAEQRYSELVTLRRAMIDENGLADALEQQGLCQEHQIAYDRAVVCWEEAALICKSFDLKDRQGPVVSHLKRGYQALGMHDELEEFDREWAVQA